MESATPEARVNDRLVNAIPDTLDFRDKMYIPTLVEVPIRIDLEDYLAAKVPVLDQGREGACTGFGLSTVAHFLLRCRKVIPDATDVSPRMFYEMAKRHDEWPGESYDGSSARGAMKGWHKHGVCASELWPYYKPDGKTISPDRNLTAKRSRDALLRPLGAYFRVNHKDLVAMHSAIAEVNILYATAYVHVGWERVGGNGIIPRNPDVVGGHAFAIVAYDRLGFWIQNSWGPTWGRGGFGRIHYDDWLENGTDVWVARLGAPVEIDSYMAQAVVRWEAAEQSHAYAAECQRPHIISLGNDGRLREGGTYGTSQSDVERIITKDFIQITAKWDKRPKARDLLLYAHGGLTDEVSAVQRVAEYRSALLEQEVYPLAFIWKTDFWSTVTNILKDAIKRRRSEGILDASKDFMLDRLDDALEPVARVLGRQLWDQMKQNARDATETSQGGARLVAQLIGRLAKKIPLRLHLVGHSAGSILLAPLAQNLAAQGLVIKNCILWAPAITLEYFKKTYGKMLETNKIKALTVFNLSDCAEQNDNCAGVYHKSLLYLVSNAFEDRARIPFDSKSEGIPLLGMQKFVDKDADFQKLISSRKAELVLAPNNQSSGSPQASSAAHHGDFDDDEATLRGTLARITKAKRDVAKMEFHRSISSSRDQRRRLSGRF
ncbi:MAG TPA: C1 family peptidase [Phycisphaerae bacterium]|nr:C1 family peptidase [Phycisphaerae bacterium]